MVLYAFQLISVFKIFFHFTSHSNVCLPVIRMGNKDVNYTCHITTAGCTQILQKICPKSRL